MEAKKEHNILVRIIFIICALFMLSVAVNSQTTAPTLSNLKKAKRQALAVQTDINSYLTFRIDSALSMQKAKLDTLIQNSRHQRLYLDSINRPNHQVTYTLSCVSTNTGSAYTGAGYLIGNTTAPVSNYSMSIPNGTYRVNNVLYHWYNSVTHCGNFSLIAWTNTIIAGNDNTTPGWLGASVLDNYSFVVGVTSSNFMSGATGILTSPLVSVNSQNGINGNCIFTVTNNVLYFTMVLTNTCTPGNAANYGFKFSLTKIRG